MTIVMWFSYISLPYQLYNLICMSFIEFVTIIRGEDKLEPTQPKPTQGKPKSTPKLFD